MQKVEKQDVVLSGGFGKSTNSARAGYLPICLERTPLASFAGIGIFLRSKDPKAPEGESFKLYCSKDIPFTDAHRQRLASNGVKFGYIAMADHERFRKQTEEALIATVEDPSLSVSIKSEIVY